MSERSVNRATILLSGLLLLLSLLSLQPTDAEETYVKPKNLSIRLPKIFDWELYKTSFQKIYPTIRDELARKKLFIASALKTFVHNMAFRLGKVRYFLSINQFSDITREELKKINSGIKSENHRGGESGSSVNGQSDEMEPLTGVDLEWLEQMLARIIAEKKPGYRLLAQQLQITIDDHRSKRDVGLSDQMAVDDVDEKLRSEKTKKKSWPQMSESDRRQRNSNMKIDEYRSLIDGEQPKESKKFVKRVPSTNPEHTPLELFSQAANTDGNEDGLPEQQLKLLEIIPNSVDYVKRQFTWLTDTFKQISTEDEVDGKHDDENNDDGSDGENADWPEHTGDCLGEQKNATDENSIACLNFFLGKKSRERSRRARLGYLSDISDESPPEDQVFLDYRQDGCLTIPRNQLFCGSCYAFALVALMEWRHCSQTGHLVPFSEQYVIDCGKHTGMEGCNGGNRRSMERFVRDWGVELRADYPYIYRDAICPYDKDDWHKAGYKRPVVFTFDTIYRRSVWPTILESSGPALAVINNPEDFWAYGGLVHQGHNCQEDDGSHAMLLVGHGIEDGEEYWLFRNSYGFHWGEEGYFKLSKAASDICFDGITDTKMDFLRPPLGPIEVTKGYGKKKIIRKLSPYEAHREGLLKKYL